MRSTFPTSLAFMALLGLVSSECRLHFRYARVCKHYRYSGNCNRGFEKNCQPFKITYEQPRCPHYVCKTSTTISSTEQAFPTTTTRTTTGTTTTIRTTTTPRPTTRRSSLAGLGDVEFVRQLRSPPHVTPATPLPTSSSSTTTRTTTAPRRSSTRSPSSQTVPTSAKSSTTSTAPTTSSSSSTTLTTSTSPRPSPSSPSPSAPQSSTTSRRVRTTRQTTPHPRRTRSTSSISTSASTRTTTTPTTPSSTLTSSSSRSSPTTTTTSSSTTSRSSTTTTASSRTSSSPTPSTTSASSTTTTANSRTSSSSTTTTTSSSTTSATSTSTTASSTSSTTASSTPSTTTSSTSTTASSTPSTTASSTSTTASSTSSTTASSTSSTTASSTTTSSSTSSTSWTTTTTASSTSPSPRPTSWITNRARRSTLATRSTSRAPGRSASHSSKREPILAAMMSSQTSRRSPSSSILDLMDMTCDDGRTCTLSWEMLASCTIYLKDDQHPDCNVPCRMEACKKEVHFYMNCPIYYCSWPPAPSGNTTTTTTTSSTTSTTPWTTTTHLPPPSTPSRGAYGASVTFNVLFVVFLLVIIGRRFLKNRRQRESDGPIIRRSHGLVNPLYDRESEPLLARVSFRRHRRRSEIFPMSGFDAASARFIDAAEPPRDEPEPLPSAAASGSPATLSDFANIDLEAASDSDRTRPSVMAKFKSLFRKESD